MDYTLRTLSKKILIVPQSLAEACLHFRQYKNLLNIPRFDSTMSLESSYRSHHNGELTAKDKDKVVRLAGWVHARRDHGGIIFIDLRDRYGLTQVVFDPDTSKSDHKLAESLRREDVIAIEGSVFLRKEGMKNQNLPTGEIEVFAHRLKVLARSETPPFEIDDRVVASDDMRLKYRFLDLRRPIMQKNLLFRDRMTIAARKYVHEHGFVEIETPMLVKPTPEGARDYIVPSRVHPGKFYALPQSPQLYKQICMISGVDRYFQMARCLRDEDLRADRQPEHTQMDIEMSFVDSKDIRAFVEGLFKFLTKEAIGVEIKEEFPMLSYEEAMEKYGTDKPDLRYDLHLQTVTGIVKNSDFGIFKKVIDDGGVVKVLVCHKDLSRTELESLGEFSKESGSRGMAWMKVTDKGLEGSIAKFFPEKVQHELISHTKAKTGYVLMFIADGPKKTNFYLDKLRQELARRLDLIPKDVYKFCWVVNFPLFSFNEETDAWEAEHHMFSHPTMETIDFLEKDPGKVIGDLYDIVLNGTELGSGSIRINNPELQERVMKVIGLSKEAAHKKFGFLLDAYKYGGPPHGGMGLGLDRFLALMLGTNDIREIIAFPKNKAAECPMDGSPSEADPSQLKELHISVNVVKK